MDINGYIDLRDVTDDWGPFSVDLEGGPPPGQSITDCVIRAYAGKVDKEDDRSQLTDVAAQVIEADSITISGFVVGWRMQGPTDTSLRGQKMTLVFEVTASGGGVHPFYFYCVNVA